MNSIEASEVFASIQDAISELANIAPDEVNFSDHLIEDLYLDLSTDLPKIVSMVSQELDYEFDPDAVEDFFHELEDDEDQANVNALLSFIQGEVELN